jgi:signal transduction histidine kinase/CheY-like chemotaxis protein
MLVPFVLFVAVVASQAPVTIMVLPCFFAPFYVDNIRYIWFAVSLAMVLDFGVFGNPLLSSDVGPLAPLVCKIFFHVPAVQAHFYTIGIAIMRYQDSEELHPCLVQTVCICIFLSKFLESTSKEQFLNTLDVEKRTNSFLGSVSHELRTPLHGAFLYISEMREVLTASSDCGEALHLLKTVETCCAIAKRLTEEVLAFAALKEGQLQLLPETLHVRDELDSAISFAKQKKKPNVKLRLIVDSSVPEYAFGDKVRLDQIISNLVLNAAKFTTNGEISVTCSSTPPVAGSFVLKVDVRDSGIGLSQKQCDQLRCFEAFNKLSESAAVNTEGTGLGLALSHNLALLMGGHGITIESEGVGKGSTFSFCVNLQTAAAPVPDAAAAPLARLRGDSVGSSDDNLAVLASKGEGPALSRRSLGSKRVCGCLLADDNIICREGFKIAARQASFPVLSKELDAENGLQALNLYKEQHRRISFVVLDVNMPIMGGFAAAKEIRKFEKANGLKRKLIIAATADATKDRTACNEAGIDAVICKPFTAKHLETELVAAKQRNDEMRAQITAGEPL